MPAPAADCAIGPAASAPSAAQSHRGGPNINPETGLSTDYLNHFTEAIMLLEMLSTIPECLDELRAWRPSTYAEHFAASRFSNREAIIDAYRNADPAVRQELDRASGLLNATVGRARQLMLQHIGTPEVEAIARRALELLRPLIARTAALINGTTTDDAGGQGPQAAIDAMFDR
jgi:hypothetical protein